MVLTGNNRDAAANAAYDLRAHYCIKPVVTERIEQFLRNAVSLDARVAPALQEWAARYGLSEAETDLLGRTALGESKAAIVAARRTSKETIKTQVATLLGKTGDDSLQGPLQPGFFATSRGSDRPNGIPQTGELQANSTPRTMSSSDQGGCMSIGREKGAGPAGARARAESTTVRAVGPGVAALHPAHRRASETIRDLLVRTTRDEAGGRHEIRAIGAEVQRTPGKLPERTLADWPSSSSCWPFSVPVACAPTGLSLRQWRRRRQLRPPPWVGGRPGLLHLRPCRRRPPPRPPSRPPASNAEATR